MDLRERFIMALEHGEKELRKLPDEDLLRFLSAFGLKTLSEFRDLMHKEFEESPNLPVDVGNEVVQFLEDLDS